MREADVVICANKYRSYICKGLYNLSKMPLTYENIHWINEYSDIKSLNNDIRIISTDGLMVNRNLHDFFVSKKNLAENIKYYLLGDYTEQEYEYAQSLIKKYELGEVRDMDFDIASIRSAQLLSGEWHSKIKSNFKLHVTEKKEKNK